MTERTIIHIEIPATDRQANAAFYQKVFGWTFTHSDEPMPYTMSDTPNVGIGMPDTGDNYKPGDVLVYISSEDVAADLDAIEAAGGKRVRGPFMVGDFGEMALFTDPTGNLLALWKELTPQSGD